MGGGVRSFYITMVSRGLCDADNREYEAHALSVENTRDPLALANSSLELFSPFYFKVPCSFARRAYTTRAVFIRGTTEASLMGLLYRGEGTVHKEPVLFTRGANKNLSLHASTGKPRWNIGLRLPCKYL